MLEDTTFADATVVAESRKFHWVTVLRDSVPEVTRRFNVSAFPSLMVIGRNEEKVYRWSGYKLPGPFMEELDEGLRRYRLYKRGKEWDALEPRPESLIDDAVIETMPAPSEDVPSAITILGTDLWVSQTGHLYRCDLETGAVLDSYETDTSVRGLCTDGSVLYGMQYGWTAGLPTFVIDPENGETIGEIVTEEMKVNRYYGAHAVAWRDGSMWVNHSGKISEVDPVTGEILSEIEPEARLSGLTWNGEHFVGVTRESVEFIDPATGKTVRSIPANYQLRCIHYHEGIYYMMEQPVFGYDKAHQRVRLWPERMLIYKVKLPE